MPHGCGRWSDASEAELFYERTLNMHLSMPQLQLPFTLIAKSLF